MCRLCFHDCFLCVSITSSSKSWIPLMNTCKICGLLLRSRRTILHPHLKSSRSLEVSGSSQLFCPLAYPHRGWRVLHLSSLKRCLWLPEEFFFTFCQSFLSASQWFPPLFQLVPPHNNRVRVFFRFGVSVFPHYLCLGCKVRLFNLVQLSGYFKTILMLFLPSQKNKSNFDIVQLDYFWLLSEL